MSELNDASPEQWDALVFDFRSRVGVSLDSALRDMPAGEFASIFHSLLRTKGSRTRTEWFGDESEWGFHEENTARLLEVLSYQLDLDWSDRTSDPNDAETKRRQIQAKRLKPPEHPIIPPIAHRPKAIQDVLAEQFRADVAAFTGVAEETDHMTSDEFDAAMGL